ELAAQEVARVCRGRLGLTVWRPNEGPHAVYAAFSGEQPAWPSPDDWGREERLHELLGDAFELGFEERVWWLEGDSLEDVWELMSNGAPPVRAPPDRAHPTGPRPFGPPCSSTGRSSRPRRACASRAAICSCSESAADGDDDAPRGGDRAPPAVDPSRHGQSARERDARWGAGARLPRRERRRGRALRQGAGARKPGRPDPGTRRGAAVAAALTHGHGARRRGRVAAPPPGGGGARGGGLGGGGARPE